MKPTKTPTKLDELKFCPQLASLYQNGFAEGADKEKFPLAAASTINNLVTLRRIFEELHPVKTLEIGLCCGASSLLLAGLHKQHGALPGAQHAAIDPFQLTRWKSAGLILLERAGLKGYLNYVNDYSSTALPGMLRNGDAFDLIYIDGSHIFEDVFIDAYFCSRLLSNNGVVAFDDSTDDHVAKVLKFIRKNLKESLQEVDVGKYRPDGNSLKYRIAQKMGKTQLSVFKKVSSVERSWDSRFVNF